MWPKLELFSQDNYINDLNNIIKMKVRVKYDNNTDRGVVSWLHRLPKEKFFKEICMEDMSNYGGPKDFPVNFGRGFIIADESDPLFVEFKERFPNTNFEIWQDHH